jgi:uncharacterized UPF0160 family protein
MFNLFSKSKPKSKSKITIAAHNGEFHADDVFAVATLKIFLVNVAGVDTGDIRIVRTRDSLVIENADYVVDVGAVYDPAKNRFDHHQTGGAGERANGIPYASFGLVWKTYGEQIAGSAEAAQIIDEKVVQPIDASDNGVSITKEIFSGIRYYSLSSLISSMNPTWNERSESIDEIFVKAVELAESILWREITVAQNNVAGFSFARDAYEKSPDKRVIILDQKYPCERLYMKLPEPLFIIYPKDGVWRIKAIKKSDDVFENRKDLPSAWAGKSGAELEQVSGVSGALFCHNKLFMAAAKTREAAVAMAEIALK